MGMLSAENLQNLKTHKYKDTGYTLVDTYVLNPFWEAVVRQFPRWLAPNVITLIGLCCVVSSYAVMSVFDVTFREQLPMWVCVWAAVMLFMYQTFDACDGKQARRTGSSSPLGMLVDHGCDSITTTVLILTLTQATALGHDFNLRLLACGLWNAFYFATWEEYHTHVCRTHVFNFGVTENQLFAMGLYIVSGVLGVEFYQQPMNIAGVSLHVNELILYTMVGLSTLTQVCMFVSCLSVAPSKLMAVLRLLPLLQLNLAAYALSRATTVYHEYTVVCVVLCGFFFALMVNRLIICSVTKVRTTQAPFPVFHWEIVPFFLLPLNSVCGRKG